MKEYNRKHPEFSLCGLNCVLCPRYNTEGSSKCPGCGGNEFYDKHPSCKVINCSLRHGNIEFCFECTEYPCERYETIGEKDSFISYKNVKNNLQKAKKDLQKYLIELDERKVILEKLIKEYNDGVSKGFYCIAVNNLKINNLKKIMNHINEIDVKDKKETAKKVHEIIEKYAKIEGEKLLLRK
jgi:hypothetical protein